MPDLYAINLHLQERLEREWREEVRAVEAAVWLGDAGILRNYKNGLPLRRLLRAGRIAGQEQRSHQGKDSWWIRRLADSPDQDGIRHARQRMRRYLPIDRDILHADWPLSRDKPAFWEELGKTVAAFGYLENELVSACYSLTAPPANPNDLRPEQVAAYLKWYAEVEAFRGDAMYALTEWFGKLLKEDGRVPHTVLTGLSSRLAELRHWLNALCHGAWFGLGVPPKLIIFNGFLVGAGAQHCQGQIRQRDRFATTMTIPTRNGDFGATRAGSEWPAPRAHSTACPNA